jgi:hypothetical protein
LIDWAVSVRYDDIPSHVLAKGGLVIADDLAAGRSDRPRLDIMKV